MDGLVSLALGRDVLGHEVVRTFFAYFGYILISCEAPGGLWLRRCADLGRHAQENR